MQIQNTIFYSKQWRWTNFMKLLISQLAKYQCVFVNNAATDHLGVEDYEILSSAILSGTDVFLRYGWYGKDNRIFDELDANNRIKRENYNEIIRYSSK